MHLQSEIGMRLIKGNCRKIDDCAANRCGWWVVTAECISDSSLRQTVTLDMWLSCQYRIASMYWLCESFPHRICTQTPAAVCLCIGDVKTTTMVRLLCLSWRSFRSWLMMHSPSYKQSEASPWCEASQSNFLSLATPFYPVLQFGRLVCDMVLSWDER